MSLSPYMNKKLFYTLVFAFMLLTITLIGFYQGVFLENGSKDAQWYPANLFAQNIDFYSYYLENINEWFMRSVPNYYFQLYYFLYPIASVSWDTFKIMWFLLNLSLLLFFFLQLKKDFAFDFKIMSIIFLPFFFGFPLIGVFTNGQTTILIIMLTYMAWKFRDHKTLLPIFLSLLTFKYSFGLPILLGFFLMGYYRSVIVSGLITLIFPLIYAIQFKLNFYSTIFLPFKVATNATANALGGGPSNVMSLYGLFFDGPLLGINVLTIGLLLFVMAFSYVAIKYRLDKRTILVGSLVFSLFGFYHNGHDYTVFLLILPFVFEWKYFKILYGYLLLFCATPRIIRILGMITGQEIGVKEFMYNKYFVLFNACMLITLFVVLLVDDLVWKRKNLTRETSLELLS